MNICCYVRIRKSITDIVCALVPAHLNHPVSDTVMSSSAEKQNAPPRITDQPTLNYV